MTALALILAVCACALTLAHYVRSLHVARRPVRIQTQRTVRDPTDGRRRTEMYEHAYPQPPGPMPWPIIGNLVTLGKYEVPFIGLTALAKQYGDCYSLTLGSTRCLVVNNLELIREVLNQNGKFFGGRPDFLRFHTLFGGDRANCEYCMRFGECGILFNSLYALMQSCHRNQGIRLPNDVCKCMSLSGLNT